MIAESGKNLAFLLGVPRSGTTLLSAMLDKHPRVLCPPEPWFMLALAAMGQTHPSHPADPQLLGDATRLFCAGEAGDAAMRAYVTTLLNRKLAEAGRDFFVDKTPRYFHILPLLRRLFPRARFVWLCRDPFDVAASYKTTWHVDIPRQLRDYPRHRACIDLLIGLRRLRDFAAGDAGVLSIRYEDLVEQPQELGEQVLAFLGASPAGNLTELDMAGSAFGTSPFGDKNILQTSRPHRNSVGAWEKTFEDEDLQILLDALRPDVLGALGYAQTVERLSARGVVAAAPANPPTAWLARVETGLAERVAEIDTCSTLAGGGAPESDGFDLPADLSPLPLTAMLRELQSARRELPQLRRTSAEQGAALQLLREQNAALQLVREQNAALQLVRASQQERLTQLEGHLQTRLEAIERVSADLAAKTEEAATLRAAKEKLERPGALFAFEWCRARRILRQLVERINEKRKGPGLPPPAITKEEERT